MTTDRRYRLLTDYAERTSDSITRLTATTIRARSLAARDIIAHRATAGAASTDEVIGRFASSTTVPPAWNGSDLLALAGVMARGQIRSDDIAGSLAIFRAVEDTHGASVFDTDAAGLYLQVLYALKNHAGVAERLSRFELHPSIRSQLEVDILNPDVGGTGTYASWLRRFNAAFQLDAIGSVAVPESIPIFDALSAQVAGTATGPLVTVIVTAFRPGPELFTAITSLTRQTWQDLEILLVDDASGPDYHDVLDHASSLDPRIRLLPLANNGGTYRARNVAMSLARGEYITTQDSDDWSHPMRIENSVAPLEADPSLPATKGACIRVSEELVMNRIGYRPVHPCASSTMIRRRDVLAAAGFYDEVRKSADTEFELRIEAAFRRKIRKLSGPPVMIYRLGSDSLSRDEFRPGWRHPARSAYRSGYSLWHEAIRNRTANPFLTPGSTPRPFPAPIRFRRHRRRESFDVILVGDLGTFGGPQASLLAELDALVDHGLRVGISHMEPLRFMTARDRPIHPRIQAIINGGKTEFVALDDPVEVDLVILRYPPLLQFPPSAPTPAWRPNSVWIVANQAPAEPDGTDRRYIVDDCSRHARALFGIEATWVPQGPNIRRIFESEEPPEFLAPFDDPAIIDIEHWFTEHRPWEQEHVRIGRYSRDNWIKFPSDPATMLAAYPSSSDFEVRMMGAAKVVPALLDPTEVPDNWKLLKYNATPTVDFLKTIDFFVYFDNPSANEAFGRSMLEAIASGVVVILDEKHKDTFGEAALYMAPEEVEERTRALHADPTAYREQVSRGLGAVEKRFSAAAFSALVRQHGLRQAENELPTEPPALPDAEITIATGACIASFHTSNTSPRIDDVVIVADDDRVSRSQACDRPFTGTSEALVIGGLPGDAARIAEALEGGAGDAIALAARLRRGIVTWIKHGREHIIIPAKSTRLWWAGDAFGAVFTTKKSNLTAVASGTPVLIEPGTAVRIDTLSRATTVESSNPPR